MKKIFCLAMLGLTVLGAYEPIPPAPAGGDSLASHLTFKLDFSNGTKASIARGNATPRLNFQPAYVDGFSGKATTARQSGKVDILRYEMKDNLDVTKPGTLIIRSKILDAGKLPKSAVCLFLTEYRKTGYIPFQGQYRKDGKWGMDLYFIGFEGIGRPSTGTAVDWKPGEWAQWALTWDGLQFNIFFNGKLEKSITLPRKPKTGELSKDFTFPLVSGVALDEVRIYDIMLSAEEISRLCRKDMAVNKL